MNSADTGVFTVPMRAVCFASNLCDNYCQYTAELLIQNLCERFLK